MNTLRPSKYNTFTAVPGAGRRPTVRTTLCALLALAGLTAGLTAQGAIIPKADNNSALDLGASWTGGTAPGTGDIASWDNTVVVNTNNDVLGAALSWSGIQIANPAGPITIPADGNTLTVGTSGINLSQASKSLTLSNTIAITSPQHWQVGNGRHWIWKEC